MKTQLKSAAIAAALLLGGTACQKDFLTEVPQDFVAPENFYRNAGDAVTAVNAVYSTFINLQSPFSSSDYMGRNLWMVIEYPTETVTSRLSNSNERSLFGTFDPVRMNSTHTYLEGIYQAAYAGINRANSVIDRVPSVPMDATRRDQIVAEAKFLRGLHYFYLAGLFGGVPLKLEQTTAIGSDNVPRNTAAETWAQIEKDASEAAAVLPVSWSGGDYGRVTKGAALTLLAKAYLQSVSQTGDASAYQKALDALKQVQGLGYTLDANYASLFDGSNEKSGEIIFSFQNVNVPGAGGTITQWFVPNPAEPLYTGGNQQNQFQAERPFYDAYNATDIRKAGTWLVSYAKKDGRVVTWTWATTNIGSTGKNIVDPVNYGSTGPVPRKYYDLSGNSSGAEAPDVVIYRYADVLLLAAEAINEISGPTAEAYANVNLVRARAKVPNLTAGLSQAAFRDSLFTERRFELAMEMHGIFDSRRNWSWAKARVEANMAQVSTLNKSPFTSSVEKFPVAQSIPDKWKLYPIPVHACQFNPLLKQNPGWDDGVCAPSTP
jgi:starch-binding outer membrane protein, SusD/RagB family